MNGISRDNPLVPSVPQASEGFQHTGLPWRLFFFSAFLFGFSVFIYFGLRVGYQSYLSFQSRAIQKNIDELAASINIAEQESLVNFYSQLAHVEGVLDRHRFSSNVFSFLEANTLRSVYFTGAQFAAAGFTLKLSGRAETLQDVASQLAVFQSVPGVAQATLDRMGFENGQVAFDLALTFQEAYFNTLL